MIVDQAHLHHVYHVSPRHASNAHAPPEKQQQQQQHRHHQETAGHHHDDDVTVDMTTKTKVSNDAIVEIEEKDEIVDAEIEKEEEEGVEGEEEKGGKEKEEQTAVENWEEKEEKTDGEDELEAEELVSQRGDGEGQEGHVTAQTATDVDPVGKTVPEDATPVKEGCSRAEKVTPPPNYDSLSAKLPPTAPLPPSTNAKNNSSKDEPEKVKVP